MSIDHEAMDDQSFRNFCTLRSVPRVRHEILDFA